MTANYVELKKAFTLFVNESVKYAKDADGYKIDSLSFSLLRSSLIEGTRAANLTAKDGAINRNIETLKNFGATCHARLIEAVENLILDFQSYREVYKMRTFYEWVEYWFEHCEPSYWTYTEESDISQGFKRYAVKETACAFTV